MNYTREDKEKLIKEMVSICLEENRYIYVLDEDIEKISTTYLELVWKSIGNDKSVIDILNKSLVGNNIIINDDIYTKMANTIDKILYINLKYYFSKDDELWYKEFDLESEYYLYISKLALEHAIDCSIEEKKNEFKDSYLEIRFKFPDYQEFKPAFVVFTEFFESNISTISDNIEQKITEIHTGSMDDDLLYSIQIKSDEEYESKHGKEISIVIEKLLAQSGYGNYKL